MKVEKIKMIPKKRMSDAMNPQIYKTGIPDIVLDIPHTDTDALAELIHWVMTELNTGMKMIYLGKKSMDSSDTIIFDVDGSTHLVNCSKEMSSEEYLSEIKKYVASSKYDSFQSLSALAQYSDSADCIMRMLSITCVDGQTTIHENVMPQLDILQNLYFVDYADMATYEASINDAIHAYIRKKGIHILSEENGTHKN